MANRSFILFARSAGWAIGSWPETSPTPADVAVEPDASPAEIAAAVLTALQAAGYTGNPVALCIPSAWCMSASVSLIDLPRNDSKAMLYRLEENLPLAAESVVADFIFAGRTGSESALGVCARLDLIAPLVEALEAAGIAVLSILPAAFAIAQGLASSTAKAPSILLCGEADAAELQLNVIALHDGRPTHWALVPATESDLKLQFDLLSTEFGSIPSLLAIDVEPDLADALVETSSQVINILDQSGLSAAVEFAAEVLGGRSKPWVEFRRDQLAIADPLRLYRKWIDRSLVAGIALLLSLAVVFFLRAHRYAHLEQASSAEMIAAFHEHFPGWDIPVNVRAVVDAQYRRAAGAPTSALAGAVDGSALTTLHNVLIPMMAQDHFQIDRMAFHENGFEIAGRLQSYEQVDALSKVARTGGMVVAPAQTRKDADGTWTFVIQGARPAATPKPEKITAD